MTPILLSLRPAYADLVFKGLKKAELRRRIATDMEGRDVFIYVSSPVQRVRGGFTVGKVWSGPPETIWEQVSTLAQVDKKDFDLYYAGCSVAFALGITSVWEYKTPSSLVTLRKRFADFAVPQSWRYLQPGEHRSFRRMTRIAKHAPDAVNRQMDVHELSCVRKVYEAGDSRSAVRSSR